LLTITWHSISWILYDNIACARGKTASKSNDGCRVGSINDEKEKILKNNDECRMMNDEKKYFS
jgi:hypothetical protein